ncbi:hypothetical protein BGX29_006533 [Mortierella sp. GBA35]|nr:hypothetical protein BGX29_006533 [Mortierella sp. GBA35]
MPPFGGPPGPPPMPPQQGGHPGAMAPPGQQPPTGPMHFHQQQQPPHLGRMPPPPVPPYMPPPGPAFGQSAGMEPPFGAYSTMQAIPGMPPGGPGVPPTTAGGQRPPGLPGTPGAPPGALMAGTPPKSAGAAAAQGGAMAVGGALPDNMNTLFIGSIAPGINNVAMEKLLKTTGNLTKWRRLQDSTTQKWSAFGFAEYADADSLLRTLRIIGKDGQQPKGEKAVGLELTAMDGSGVVKALLVKVDDKIRQFLEVYEESRPRTILDTEKDKLALASATKIIQQMKDGTLDTSEPAAGSDDATNDQPSSSSAIKDDGLPPRPRRRDADGSTVAGGAKAGENGDEEEVSEEQKETIARELNFYRERAALKEKERRDEEERNERMTRSGRKDSSAATGSNASTSSSHRAGRDRAWGGSSSGSRQSDSGPASGANHIEVGSATAQAHSAASTSMNQDTGMDSEEEEKTRQERRDREAEHTFKERERRWEQREVERMRLYEKDKARDADYVAESHAARDTMAARYAQWNDDVERDRRHDDYYRDRSKWWHKRQAFLQKEQRYDDLDREEEKEELAQEAAKKAAQEADAAAAAAAAASGTDTAMDVDSSAAGQVQDVEMKEEEAASGSISSTTADVAINQEKPDTTIKQEKEETEALVIPSDAQELWNWPIQWQYVDENDGLILQEKILPFANKIVVELLGVQEDTLTKYLVDHIQQRKPPQDLVVELRGALDNDADVLVERVWRLLVEETESRARKQ